MNDGPGKAEDSRGSRDFAIDPAIAGELHTLGRQGERALGLLQHAALVLSDPPSYPAPYEVAQSCCRGALDSLLKIAGEEFPGLQSASKGVIAGAKAVVEGWRSTGEGQTSDLEELERAVRVLAAEQANPGGYRVQQIDHLVRERARQGLGTAERKAAAESWGKIYGNASSVLHGSGAEQQDSVDLFLQALEAIRQLFLSLPLRAERLRELARNSAPTAAEADEVALMTDPRAGAYFFRSAISEKWLGLLPPERLLPEQDRWPAYPYMRRELERDPDRVIKWLTDSLAGLRAIGPSAVEMAAELLVDAGIAALPLMRRILNAPAPSSETLARIAYWVQKVPNHERTRDWGGVIGAILGHDDFLRQEDWEAAQLLRALVSTAYPGTEAAPPELKLIVGIRYVLASILDRHGGADGKASVLDTANDLTTVQMDLPARFAHIAGRAVLDLALHDAQHGIGLEDRLAPLRKTIQDKRVLHRLVAVHLRETCGIDLHDERATLWWNTAIVTAEAVVKVPCLSADVADFLDYLNLHCPKASRPQLIAGLQNALEHAPDTAEVHAWLSARSIKHQPLSARWLTVWKLSPVLPDGVLERWRPLLTALAEITGSWPAADPEPLGTTGDGSQSALTTALLARQAVEDGAPAAMTSLALAPLVDDEESDEARANAVRQLVETDPQIWAREPDAVAAPATPVIQAAYFDALRLAIVYGRLDREEFGVAAATAAFTAARTALPAGAGAGPLQEAACMLLHNAWIHGADLGELEDAAAQWLTILVDGWVQPRAAEFADSWYVAVNCLGGRALCAMIAWGTSRAQRNAGQLPDQVSDRLNQLLDSADDALALAVVGYHLPVLFRSARRWAADKANLLLGYDQNVSPVQTWLKFGVPDGTILARFDRRRLFATLLSLDEDRRSDHVVSALLDVTDPLGSPQEFLTDFASFEGGAESVSQLFVALARVIKDSASPITTDRVCAIWQAAIQASLPGSALAGTGTFALVSKLDDERWLELTASTVAQTQALDSPDRVAMRAEHHPSSPLALQIATATLAMQTKHYHQSARIKSAAQRLFEASGPGMSTARRELQHALINAGVVEVAFIMDGQDPTDESYLP